MTESGIFAAVINKELAFQCAVKANCIEYRVCWESDGNCTNKDAFLQVCVQCAGVVLSAGFMCRESAQGLTLQCVNDVMGLDGACNACINQYLNIS